MRRCAESVWETWKCHRDETYVQRNKNMKLETDGYKYPGTDNQKLPVSHSTKSIPRHFIFTFPQVKSRRFSRFQEKRKNRQGASACLTSACLSCLTSTCLTSFCLATKSRSGAKWQEVLFCLALEMKAGCFPDKPKVTGCLSTRCVLQEVLTEP